MGWVAFYGVTLMLTGLLAAFFEPAASVLRALAQKQGQGPTILIPPAFLLLSFLYAFIKARSEAKRGRWVAAYGWLLGSSALAVILLYLYLSRQAGG